MKILYIVSTLGRSGPTNQLFDLLINLDKKKTTLFIVTLSPEPKISRWKDFEAIGVKVLSIDLGRLKGFFWAKKRLLELIRIINPAIIHSQGIRADITCCRLGNKIPTVSTIHNFPQLDYIMTYGFFLGKILTWCHIKAISRISLCVAVSKAVEDNLKKKFDISNVNFIRNGIDENKYTVASDCEKLKIRKALGIPLYSRVWVFSGHLNFRKDPLFIIEAWKLINSADDVLIMIGGGELFENCIGAINGCKNIYVLGPVDIVNDYLTASDMYISASKAEGFPMSTLEALSAGIPVLLSDIEPHTELLSLSNEKIGFLYKQGDQMDFIKKILELKEQNLVLLSLNARKLVEEKLSSLKMAESYFGFYHKIISKNEKL